MSALVSATAAQKPRPGLASTSAASAFTLTTPSMPRGIDPSIRQLRLVADEDDELDTSLLEREFPSISIARGESVHAGELVVDDFAWRGAFDVRGFDEHVEAGRPHLRIVVRGGDAVGVAVQLLARYQRLVVRRNQASSTPLFDAVLDAHAALFDEELRSDYEHALDTWQWLLRLQPDVGFAAQVAALVHDVERLDDDSCERLEHRARRVSEDDAPANARRATADGGAAHAERAGDRVLAVLRAACVGDGEAGRVRDLVLGGAVGSSEAALLDDADALSFLSLMSSRYADHFGLAQTRRKVTFMLGRLGGAARAKVPLLRLRPDVERLLRST